MAFIRQYQRRGMGDPLFGIKLPKIKLPKIKPLKLLAAGASFVPGPVGAVMKIGKLSKVLGVAKTAGKIAAGGAAFGAGASVAERALQGGFAGPAMPTWGPAGLEKAGGGALRIDPITGAVTGRKRYRRMNVTNMKALTRASRRVHRFAKLARTCIRQAQTTRCPKKGSRGRKTC